MRRVVAVLVLALLVVAGCGDAEPERDASQQPQGASLRVTIGTQEFPEARIIGELWRQALAVNGYAVNLRKGIGPAQDLDEALKAGEIDGYVAYTGTVLSIVAGQEVTGLDSTAATQLLWDTYHPHYIWIPFACIGVVAAVALYIFGQKAKKWSDMNA